MPDDKKNNGVSQEESARKLSPGERSRMGAQKDGNGKDRASIGQFGAQSDQQLNAPGAATLVSSSPRPIKVNNDSQKRPEDERLIGQIMAGKYKMTRFIGRGGMGTIFEAVDLSLNRPVAIKLLSSLTQDTRILQRFQQEGKATSRLNHPNIVKVYDFGIHNQVQPYMVMEFVHGESLGDIIAAYGRLDLKRSIDIVIQICRGLEHAHQHRVVHRDLKPGNILIGNESAVESVKIVDFGIAKIATEDGVMQSLTSTGEIFGSPLYMSPEQCFGYKLDGRSDLYSLGCLFYECLTGFPPLVGDSPLVTISKHQQEKPLSLKEATLGCEFPLEIEAIVAKMLAKAPDDRFQSATAIEFELLNFLEGGSSRLAPDMRVLSAGEQFQRDAAGPIIRQFQPIRVAEPQKQPNWWLISGIPIVILVIFIFVLNFAHVSTPTSQKPVPVHSVIGDATKAEIEKAVSMANANIGTEQSPFGEELRQYPNFESMSALDASGRDVFSWSFLSKMKKLEYLNLFQSEFGDSDLVYIKDLPIKILRVSGTKIDNAGLETISKLASLKRLEIGGDEFITDAGLAHLNQNLRELFLVKDVNVTDSGIKNFSQLKFLRRLELREMRISDKCIDALARCSSLNYVDITGTKISPAGARRLQQLLPNCLVDQDSDMTDFREWFNKKVHEKESQNSRPTSNTFP